MAAYGFGDLGRDVRKALSLSPADAMRRLSGRATRYVRRLRNRGKARGLSDGEFLSALTRPAGSITEVVSRRLQAEPLVPASLGCVEMGKTLLRIAPGALEPILSSARAAAEGTFNLLGSGPVQLGEDPDWQLDFKSGKRWEAEAYSLEIVQTPGRGHDIKVPWEMARLQHLPTLGIATALTGDPLFRNRAVAQVASFLARNPAYRGVNWNCTMDVALRAAGMLASEGYLRGSGDERFWADLLKALLAHGRFIRDNLEDGPVRGNHFLSDLAGLYLCGLALPEFREASSWRVFARETLTSEMQRQVTHDGFDTEASTSYHAFVTEMILFPALLASEKGDPFPPDYLSRLDKMLAAVAALIRPDGTLPQIGDNDDGRFLIFSQYHRPRRDWRPLMALGGYLFRRADWLALSGDAWVEGAWVIGEPFLRWREGLPASSGVPPFRSCSFPEAGIYQLAAGPVSMVVDAGGVGQGGNGGHAHNDTLAFDLYAFGEEILPDRGTGTYTPDLGVRNRFRSTGAHNTIRVDGQEINPFPEEPFRLIPVDSPRVLRWRAGSRTVYLSAEQNGYRRLPSPLVHRRRILLDSTRRIFRVGDHFEGRGRHRFEASYHLAPGWTAGLDENGWSAHRNGEKLGLRLRWVHPPPRARARVEEDLHSPSYGVIEPACAIRIEWEDEAPCGLTYELIPCAGEER